MLTNEQKNNLKPVTEKLKKLYSIANPGAVIIIDGKISVDFMFWVVNRYEGIVDFSKNEISELIKMIDKGVKSE